MSEEIKAKAVEAEAIVQEVNSVILVEPKEANAVVPLAQADAVEAEEIRKRMNEIDMGDTNSIVSFGSAAQAELQEISQAMLTDVRNKDVGPAGNSLRNMVTTIRGFSSQELDINREQSLSLIHI